MPEKVVIPEYPKEITVKNPQERVEAVSYTHLRAHETVLDLVCRLLLEKKKHNKYNNYSYMLQS